MFETNRQSVPLGLQDKFQRIDENKRGFTARRVTNIGKALGLAAFNEICNVSKKHLTPAFIVAKRQRRVEKEEEARQTDIQRKTQIDLDAKLEAARIARRKTIQAQLNAKRRITQSAPTVQRARGIKDSHRCQELSRRLVDRDRRNDEQRKEMELRRLAEQAAEAKRLADAKAKRRQVAAAYWSQQAEALREEVERIKSTMSITVEATPKMPAATEETREELLNHPQSTIFQDKSRKSNAQSVGGAATGVGNHFLPLFSTKQPYDSELIRAKLAEVEALQGNQEKKLSDLQSNLNRVRSTEALLSNKQKVIQSSIRSQEEKCNDIVSGLQLPYPREPNKEQRAEMHCLKSSISQAKAEINSICNSCYRLAERKGALMESIDLMKSKDFVEKMERTRSELLPHCAGGPPMVLGRRLSVCTNIGDIPNPSSTLEDIITRSNLELQRVALPPSRSITDKRRVDRRIRDRASLQKDYIDNLITDRTRKIASLSRQLLKKRREALNKEIVAFVAAGKSLRMDSTVTMARSCEDDERLCSSEAAFDRRKHALDGHDFICIASRGLCLGDEHCIYDLNTPTGIHKMKLCHDASFNGGNADSETPLLEERRIQEQRKAEYDDNIDFVGRIQGFHKKLQDLETSQTELRQRYAEAVGNVHECRLCLGKKEVEETSDSALEEAESKAKEMKLALLNLCTEIQTKRTAMRALKQKYQRYQRLMLRRSILANNFFPRERRRMLSNAFGRWRYYNGWSVKTKEMVKRKHGVLMRAMIAD